MTATTDPMLQRVVDHVAETVGGPAAADLAQRIEGTHLDGWTEEGAAYIHVELAQHEQDSVSGLFFKSKSARLSEKMANYAARQSFGETPEKAALYAAGAYMFAAEAAGDLLARAGKLVARFEEITGARA